VAKGARVLCGGARHARGGNFFQPTVLADVTTGMKVAREETFGPVAPLFRFTTEAEAIALANDTEFGLAAYFFRATSAAAGGSAKRWNTAWSGSIPG
jgi:succinate-semialdehyde dehydrogenase/glutarate-semialdehyde dehydrogenase